MYQFQLISAGCMNPVYCKILIHWQMQGSPTMPVHIIKRSFLKNSVIKISFNHQDVNRNLNCEDAYFICVKGGKRKFKYNKILSSLTISLYT